MIMIIIIISSSSRSSSNIFIISIGTVIPDYDLLKTTVC